MAGFKAPYYRIPEFVPRQNAVWARTMQELEDTEFAPPVDAAYVYLTTATTHSSGGAAFQPSLTGVLYDTEGFYTTGFGVAWLQIPNGLDGVYTITVGGAYTNSSSTNIGVAVGIQAGNGAPFIFQPVNQMRGRNTTLAATRVQATLTAPLIAGDQVFMTGGYDANTTVGQLTTGQDATYMMLARIGPKASS